jgi:hypothetical protein
MESIYAEDIKVGMTVVNRSGDKYTVTKIEVTPYGIKFYDKDKMRNQSGKKVVFHLVHN